MITQVRQAMWRGNATGIMHLVAARLHPPDATSAAGWSQATEQLRSPTVPRMVGLPNSFKSEGNGGRVRRPGHEMVPPVLEPW